MWRPLAPMILLSLGLEAQGVRLCERIEAPMAYVAIDVAATAGGAGPLARLLGDDALGGSAAAGAREVLQMVGSVLGRAAGPIELVLTGVLPPAITGAQGLPLLVVRTRLLRGDAERLRAVLAEGRVATRKRVLFGHPTYGLAVGAAAATGGTAGLCFEAAVVGDDLVAANNELGLEQALGDRTSATPRCLSNDPRYRRLIERLQPAPGALVLFADWQRLGPRLARLHGIAGAFWRWSGLEAVDAVAAAVAPHDAADPAIASTVLLSLGTSAPIDGWLGTIEPVAMRQIVDDLPVGGLGGCVFAVDPQRIADQATAPGGFAAGLRGACSDVGLEPARIVRRLGRRGAMQLLLLSDPDLTVAPAFALQAQNRKAAADLVEEIARALGEPMRGSDRNSPSVTLRDAEGLERLRLGVVDDLLVFAQEAEVVAALAAARRERARGRTSNEAALAAVLRAFGRDRSDRVGGLLQFDARAWLEAVGVDPEPRSSAARVPMRHAGVLDIERGPADTVVRLQLLSSR